MRRCEDYTRERKSEFMMECPKDRDDGCLTVFQGMWGSESLRGDGGVTGLLSIVSLTRC